MEIVEKNARTIAQYFFMRSELARAQHDCAPVPWPLERQPARYCDHTHPDRRGLQPTKQLLPIGALALTYHTQSGDIRVPPFDAHDRDYSRLALMYEADEGQIIVREAGLEIVSAVAAWMLDAPHFERGTNDPIEAYAYRLRPITRAHVASRRIYYGLRSMQGAPEIIGTAPGDHVIIDSLIEYNAHLAHYRNLVQCLT